MPRQGIPGTYPHMGSSAYAGAMPVYYNVCDFGATGDGHTDDTAKIADTFHAAVINGGGIVFFPEGVYCVSAPLQLDTTGLCIWGTGKGSIIRPLSSFSGTEAVHISADETCLLHVSIGFADPADASNPDVCGVTISGGTDITLSHLTVSTSVGINISGGKDIAIDQVRLANNATTGVDITGGDLINLNRCAFDGNNQSAVVPVYDLSCASADSHVTVSECVFATPTAIASGSPAASGTPPTLDALARFHLVASGETQASINVTDGTVLAINNMFLATTAFAGLPTAARSNIGYNPVGGLTAPAVPASETPYTNAFGVDCSVYVTGGTVTAIAIGTTPTGLTSGMVFCPAGSSITLTYSVAPTWVWIGS